MSRTTRSWWDTAGSESCSLMFAHALYAVIVSDEGGRIVEFNAAAEQMFQMERAEVLGREFSEILLPESLRRDHREALRRRATHGPEQPLPRRMETTALRHDGSAFPVEVSITSLPVNPPIFIAFLRDLSIRDETGSETGLHQLLGEATCDIMTFVGLDRQVLSGPLGRPPARVPDVKNRHQPIHG
jgi:PAS domain S-box-containing protein